MADIDCVIMDFDGTLTDFGREGPLFESLYRSHLAEATSLSIINGWAAAAAAVDADPESLGLRVEEGRLTAPGDADPYVRCFAISQELNRRLTICPALHELQPIAARCYAKAYSAITESHWSAEMFRTDGLEFLRRVQRLGLAIWLVSNADPRGLHGRLACLPEDIRASISLLGNAEKYSIRLPARLDTAFEALPEHQRLPGLARPIELRRGSYFDALRTVWQHSRTAAHRTLVVGDVYDMDLALPAALGAHVHLVQPREIREPYRAALGALEGGRGSFHARLTAALDARDLVERPRGGRLH